MPDPMAPKVTRQFQISEPDLAELERVLPHWQDRMFADLDTRTKMEIRRVQQILINVRWAYGPPQQVETIAQSGVDDE